MVPQDQRDHQKAEAAAREQDAAAQREAYRIAAYGATVPSTQNTSTECEDVDEDFLELRRKRLEGLKKAAQQAQQAPFPVFGEVREVDPSGLLDGVDNEDPRVLVVVHLYAPRLPPCVRLNNALESLARRLTSVKVRLLAGSE